MFRIGTVLRAFPRFVGSPRVTNRTHINPLTYYVIFRSNAFYDLSICQTVAVLIFQSSYLHRLSSACSPWCYVSAIKFGRTLIHTRLWISCSLLQIRTVFPYSKTVWTTVDEGRVFIEILCLIRVLILIFVFINPKEMKIIIWKTKFRSHIEKKHFTDISYWVQ